MKAPLSKTTAEARVVKKYHKLYEPLLELVGALQHMEPGGTLVEEATFTRPSDEVVRVHYVAKPAKLTIVDGKRTFTLEITELSD